MQMHGHPMTETQLAALPTQIIDDGLPVGWRNSVKGIIDVAKFIEEKHASLTHEGFKEFVKEARVNIATAMKIKSLLKNPIISNPDNFEKLPPAWAKLYELSMIESSALQSIIDSGQAHTMTKYQIWDMRESSGSRKRVNKNAQLFYEQHPEMAPPPRKRREAVIPAGKTILECVEAGMEAERLYGYGGVKAAQVSGLSTAAYRMARNIVVLKTKELSESDKKLVDEAYNEMVSTNSITSSYNRVKSIATKIWGGRGGYNVSILTGRIEETRIEKFKTAITIMVDTCLHATSVDVPHLGADDIEWTRQQIHAAKQALREFGTKLKREM